LVGLEEEKGRTLGRLDGGNDVGFIDGSKVGELLDFEGWHVGFNEGIREEGEMDGVKLGFAVGYFEGKRVGIRVEEEMEDFDGINDGRRLRDGNREGGFEFDGSDDGFFDVKLGFGVGFFEGTVLFALGGKLGVNDTIFDVGKQVGRIDFIGVLDDGFVVDKKGFFDGRRDGLMDGIKFST